MLSSGQKTGIANLPLHYGKVPPWLFGRMSQLAREITIVVIDEFAGQWLTFLFLPVDLMLLLAGFVLFRIFDILKPFPANHTQRISGGLGIMLDDLIAAIYAQAVLRITLFFIT